jgi:hypothetical protein
MSEIRSGLLELLQGASDARKVLSAPKADLGIADIEPFPFLAIVGQEEMKLALVLAVINPLIGGVLLVGSRGTAKTTAVHSLIDLLPVRRRSVCPEGCTEELLEEKGMEVNHWNSDVYGRDFTINSLYRDLFTGERKHGSHCKEDV